METASWVEGHKVLSKNLLEELTEVKPDLCREHTEKEVGGKKGGSEWKPSF